MVCSFPPLRVACVAVCLVVTLVAGAAPRNASAQIETDVGVTLGLNLATIRTDAPSAPNLRTGFMGGLVLQVRPRGVPVHLQPELLFVQKGTALDRGDGEIRFGASYIELPLLLQADAPSIGPVTPHVVGGGFGGVKVAERQSVGGLGGNLPLQTDESYFERFDAGLVGGLGGTLGLGDSRLTFTARYAYGLVDVAQDDTRDLFDELSFPTDARTSTWFFLLRFGL